MTEEDEAFNEIERRSKVKQTLVVHKSKEVMLIAEVAVLTEMVRGLSDKLAIEQNKQEQGEPVALVTGVYGGRFTYAPFKESLILPVGMALYSSPQQRTWVGLTDEDDIDWEDGGNLKDLVKAIEAKLREKNT
jgi:hypothetical protein